MGGCRWPAPTKSLNGPTSLKMEVAGCEGPDGSVHICCTAGRSVWGPGVILLWRKK